ncbi:MAG: contractile injection system tape measure protein, partial [Pseudomonadota bacterium]
MSAQPASVGSLVETAQFDLGFEVSSLAHARQGTLDGYIRERLLPVIDEVMDEADTAGWVVTLDRLEIDLGQFADARFEGEAPERLRTRLREALREALYRAIPGPASAAGEQRATVAEHELRLLLRFLDAGRIGARHLSAQALSALGHRVLTEQSSQVVIALRARSNRTQALVRLLRQFPGAPATQVARAVLGR